jgi:NAD(P)-dependent dehydrogenase (short-subunit alcohol dehydrogenase family)
MREIPPEWGSFLRFALAVPLFLLVLGRPPRLAPLGETLFLALSGVALFNLVFFTGMRLAPASDASADQARTLGISPEEVVEKVFLAQAAIRRLIEPEEVAELALFLASEKASAITGAVLPIDLGWTAR